ncbi:MAG: DMT family transporter [Sphingobacteriales bacterium]|nr:DMT family transporter [Sphingobacteriales bacterium]
MKTSAKAHIAVLFTNFFFATNLSMVKHISPSLVGPYGLNIFRVGISLLLFWTVWFFGKTPAGIQRKHLVRFLFCGLTGVAINQMLFVKGLTLTSTIHASLLMLCTPLLITLFAFWILKEKMTGWKITGLVLGIGGAVLLILSKEKNGTASLAGDLFIVVNAMAYTVYFILVKPLMQEYPPLQVVRWVFTFGFIMILPFGWTQCMETAWPLFEWTHTASLVLVVFCGTFLAYSFNVFGIKHLGAAVTGSYIYTQPVFAAIIAALFLHESFTIEKLIAGLLIFSGVYLVSRKAPPTLEE